MKCKLLSIIAVTICIHSFAQTTIEFPIDATTKEISFNEVVQVDSADAQSLYSRAKLMIATLYNSGKDVTQLNDDNTKTVVVKALIKNTLNTMNHGGDWGYTTYTLTIQCKDSRYRYILTDFRQYIKPETSRASFPLTEDFDNKFYTRSGWNKIREQDYEQIQLIIQAMKKYMASAKNDNW